MPPATWFQLAGGSQGSGHQPQPWVYRLQQQLSHRTEPLERIILRITKDHSLNDYLEPGLSSPRANSCDVPTSEARCEDKHDRGLQLFQILLQRDPYNEQEPGRTAKPHRCLLLISLLSSFNAVNTYA